MTYNIRFFPVDSRNRIKTKVQYVLDIDPIRMTWPEEHNHESHSGANNHEKRANEPTGLTRNRAKYDNYEGDHRVVDDTYTGKAAQHVTEKAPGTNPTTHPGHQRHTEDHA